MNHLLARPHGRCICGADLAGGAWIWADGQRAWQCANPDCWQTPDEPGIPLWMHGKARVWHFYAGPLIIRRAPDCVTVEAR